MADNDVDFRIFVDESPAGTTYEVQYHRGSTIVKNAISQTEARAIVTASDTDRPGKVQTAFGNQWTSIPIGDRSTLLGLVNSQVAASKTLFA